MNVGAFAIVAHLSGAEKLRHARRLRRAGTPLPLLAAILTIFLLSLIGIPITGGFFAKFYVFSAALQANLVGLTIIGVINSAIAAYYYLRVIVYMYMRDERLGARSAHSRRARRRTGDQSDRDHLPRRAARARAGLRAAGAQDLMK